MRLATDANEIIRMEVCVYIYIRVSHLPFAARAQVCIGFESSSNLRKERERER